tara:strand:- start:189 stop:317 length:129 start_codon:yes stop_codon:yes gene_type:complete
MKTIYITLGLFAILFALFLFMFFVDIPSPSKSVVENYNLEIK